MTKYKAKAHLLKASLPDNLGPFDETQDNAIHNIWFTDLLYSPDEHLIYCGLASRDGDLLYSFDPESGIFKSLGFAHISDKFDIMIHQSLQLSTNDIIYGATCSGPVMVESGHAPGGKIFSYEPRSKKITILAKPVGLNYIHTLVLAKKQQSLYGLTLPTSKFFSYDLTSGQTKIIDQFKSSTHTLAVDDEGKIWGTYEPQDFLFCYDFRKDKIEWTSLSLPKTDDCHKYFFSEESVRLDSAINAGDGYIYLGSLGGHLAFLDPKAIRLEVLGKPDKRWRLSALTVDKNESCVYGACGEKPVNLFRYDHDLRRFYNLGIIFDEELDVVCNMAHAITVIENGTVYIGEALTEGRCGYLWECQIE